MRIKECIKENVVIYKIMYPVVFVCRYIYGVLGKTMMFYIKYFLRKLHLLPCDKNLLKYKNKHRNSRIFIVATGPSLRIEDLEWLERQGEITIAVNGIFKIFEKTNWRPTYYALDDFYLYESYKNKKIEIVPSQVSKKGVFYSEPVRKYVSVDLNEIENISYIPICYYDHWFTHYSKLFRYNREIQYGHFDAYTVTNFAINIADYMGASNIYILGADCDFCQKKAHIGEDEKGVEYENSKNMQNAQQRGYRFVNKKVNISRTKVMNATRGGKLEEFPRCSMDELINNTALTR